MRTIKGPGLFLAQFATDTPPHNTLAGIAKWAKDYGYKAIQIPSWDSRFFDLDRAYDSEAYCDEIKGTLADIGIAVSEFSTHFQGQMVSVHPAYDAMFDGQCPSAVRGNPEKRCLWAANQVRKAAREELRKGATQIKLFASGGVVFPSEAHSTLYEYSEDELEAIVEEAAGRGGAGLGELSAKLVTVSAGSRLAPKWSG